jgi:hypothetical protein
LILGPGVRSGAIALLLATSLGLVACQSPQDQAYIGIVNSHSPTTKDLVGKAVTACNGGPSPDCTAATRTAQGEVDTFKADLDKQTAPKCIGDADGKMKTALTSLSTGLGGMSQASEAKDITNGNVAIHTMNQGSDQFNAAAEQINKAAC